MDQTCSLESFLNHVQKRDPNQTEFAQAVREVMTTLWPFLEQNPRYRQMSLLERLVEPERVIQFRVVWVDNQSGCKGVCKGVESLRPDPARSPEACAGGECQDAALVDSLKQLVSETPGNLMIVLHQMGNHGPAYFKRYPDAFKQFTPACEDPDLPKCSNESIVNAYDNAIRYTDHVIASLVRTLREHDAHDSALLYVSDHGESLGEKGLFLHGVPFKIAPDVQTKVPMVMWFSPGYRSSFALDEACVGQVAATPLSHDHIFHSLLGLLDVKTSAYTPEMDFSAKCRRP